MRACIITPAPPGSAGGNRVTALRWAKFLRQLGLDVQLRPPTHEFATPVDVVVALHAVKSHAALLTVADRWPNTPRVVGIAGTDLYGRRDAVAMQAVASALDLAEAIVVLQPEALRRLPARHRAKATVILQSCPAPPPEDPIDDCLEVGVVANLRAIKDPLLCARAAAQLPAHSRVVVSGVGEALSPAWEARARAEEDRNARYRWLGPLCRRRCLGVIARARVLVVTSKAEGGANVISEAIAAGTPVLSTDVAGSTGLLGRDYPGLFGVGNTAALAELLGRVESDPAFVATLRSHGERLAPRLAPARERQAWAALMGRVLGRAAGSLSAK